MLCLYFYLETFLLTRLYNNIRQNLFYALHYKRQSIENVSIECLGMEIFKSSQTV